MNKILMFLNGNPLIILFSMILFMVPDKSDAQSWCLTPTTSSYTQFDSIIRNRNEPGPYYLRIYVHVIRDSDSTGGQSVADVYEALSYLDEAYNPHNIFFIWNDKIEYINDSAYYAGPLANSNILNYCNHNDGIAIYLFPEHFDPTAMASGIGAKSFYVSGSIKQPYRSNVKSHVMSHEMGHCLNLWHTFGPDNPTCFELVNGSNCDTCGDLVCDTPAERLCHFWFYGQYVNPIDCSWESLIVQCPVYDSTGTFNPDTKNIMTYSQLDCYEYFTQGQGQRMRNSIDTIPVLQACIYPFADSIITGTVRWDSLMLVQGNLIIETGSELAITDKVYFLSSGKIIVKPGAKLIIDGGTITTYHANTWQGIEVWGDNTKSQYPDNGIVHQGQVIVTNGSLIENASTAIYTGNRDNSGIAYNGGIIMASSSEFRNNEINIHLAPYENFHPVNEQPRDNLSYVKNCDFILTDSDITEFDPQIFVKLDGVSGISLTGNHFINQLSGENIPEITGIQSLNSSFTVDRDTVFENPSNPELRLSRFENLNYGIRALGATTAKNFTVDTTQFINNIYGIYTCGINNFFITRSLFDIYYNGVYVDGITSGFRIEENEFIGPAGLSYGIAFNNTGEAGNELYKNSFSSLLFATLALNKNRSVNTNTGLCITCNTFSNNTIDISVNDINGQYAGIAPYQGSLLPFPDAPAGNRFSWAGDENTPTDINNHGEHITYYYHVSILEPLEPKYYTGVTPVANYYAEWNQFSCPSNLNSTKGGQSEEELKSLKSDATQKADSTQALINILKDAGDTDALYWDVNMSAPWQSLELYSELMSVAPYVSDSVLEAAIEKENVLVDAMIRDVLVANPHSAKSKSLLDKLDQRIQPLPDQMLSEILEGRSLISVYEELQSSLYYYRQKEARYHKQLVRLYLYDTVNKAASADNLISLLLAENTPQQAYQAAFMRYELGDNTTAINILNNIPSAFNLDPSQLTVHNEVISFIVKADSLKQQSQCLLAPDSTTITWLMDMMDFGNEPANLYARNILLACGTVDYEPILPLPELLKSEKTGQRNIRNQASQHSALKLYPNPAKDYVIVAYDFSNLRPDNAKAVLQISSVDGKILESRHLQKERDHIVFPLTVYTPGAYMLTLYYNNCVVDTEALILR